MFGPTANGSCRNGKERTVNSHDHSSGAISRKRVTQQADLSLHRKAVSPSLNTPYVCSNNQSICESTYLEILKLRSRRQPFGRAFSDSSFLIPQQPSLRHAPHTWSQQLTTATPSACVTCSQSTIPVTRPSHHHPNGGTGFESRLQCALMTLVLA